ncbi:sigma 54-interacting transcriptional regulator [Synechococcus sp. UW105]|uniref:sigma 54-interacting transcriptional regulator n=1 Tax=Synechococcus sp. UW105 TaxID=337067 RepID=UPI000E0FECFD|nr:sigma 54-interacting transcriptional regulator [Synechococcus sp. UW105]
MSTSASGNATLQRLAPYLVARPRRGVVGNSPQARRLREALHEASTDRNHQAVLLVGEPGLEKDNLAALIHFGSSQRHQLMLRVDGAQMRSDGSELFGREGDNDQIPLLELVGEGSLLIDNFEQLEAPVRQRIVEIAATGRWQSPGLEPKPQTFRGRLLITAESAIPELSPLTQLIRVPPLRVRRQDLGDWLRYGIRQQSLRLGWKKPPKLPMAVVKQLQNYDFPNNLRELEALIERALQQVRRQGSSPKALPEDVFWTSPRQQRSRFDLWAWKPKLRNWMRAPQLWNLLLFGIVSWVFVLINLWLWFGPQDRAHNGALNLFWAWWWPLILLSFPVVGRLWCSFCPFMVWGELAQKLARGLGWTPSPWPRGDHDAWGSRWLAGGFALILLWESLCDLPQNGQLSSCLLLLITAGAVSGSIRFEKRFWCRYLCPIGGMNGLFAKLSMLELRAQAGVCSGNCSSYACFKGGPAEGEGLQTSGCPLGTHPAHLRDNRNCVLCMTCAQACPHRSVRLAIRPPAADLQRDMVIPNGEPGLVLVLTGSICLQQWQKLWGWTGLTPSSISSGPLLPRIAIACLSLALPATVYLLARLIVNQQRLEHTLYGFLPVLWALLLASHLPIGMREAGMVLPVSMEGLEGLPQFGLPSWQADPHVIRFCQSAVVTVGGLGSVVVLRRMLCNQRKAWLAACMVLISVAGCGRWLVGS